MHTTERRYPFYILIVFLLIYIVTSRGKTQNVDELTMFATLINLMENHSLAINELIELNDNIDLRIGFFGPDGNLYSKYAPGNILVAAGLYRFGALISPDLGKLMALYTNAFLGAITMTMLFVFLQRHFQAKTAIAVVLLIGLCTDWWYQSRGFGLEIGAGMLLLGSLLLAESGNDIGSAVSYGGSLLFRTLNVAAWPIWALNTRRSSSKGLWSALVIIVFILLLLSYNWIRYRSLTNFGYDNVGFTTSIWIGLPGLLFSPGRSFFVYSPILLMIIPGTWLWFRRDWLFTLAFVLTITFYIILIAKWVSWDSGWSWGSRLITPLVPLMGILITPVVDMAWRKSWLLVIICLQGIWGIGIELIALAIDPLQTLKLAVMTHGLPYKDTIYTIDNSWLALQWRALRSWAPSQLDALILRLMIAPQ